MSALCTAGAGCSSSNSNPGAGSGTGSGTGSSSHSTSGASLSFATDIYGPIVEKHCIFCHGPTADGGPGVGEKFGDLDMSSVDAGYSNLVNAPAAGVACGHLDADKFTRVVPGNAADSLLYLKVHGWLTDAGAPCGSAMPQSGIIPDGGQEAVVQELEDWINQGAKP